MQVKPKSNSVCTSVFDAASKTLTFKVLGAGECALRIGATAPEVQFEAMVRGFNQRCVNAAALGRDKDTGKSATPAEKFAGVKALVDHYNSGSADWSPARTASGPKPLDAILLAAVGEVTGKPPEVVLALVAKGAETHKLTGHQYLAKLATSPAVGKVADRLRAERVAAPDLDIDAEIEGMMGDDE